MYTTCLEVCDRLAALGNAVVCASQRVMASWHHRSRGGSSHKPPPRQAWKWALWSVTVLLSLATPGHGQESSPVPPAANPGPPSARPVPAGHQQVLLLDSWQYGVPVPDSANRGVVASLAEGGVSVTDLFVEHLDLLRKDDRDYRVHLAESLRRKLAGQRIAIIIAEGSPACGFLAQEGKELFPEVPVLTILSPGLGPLEGGPRRVIEMPERADWGGTLRVALSLFPGTRRAFMVSSASDAKMGPYLIEARKAFAACSGRLEVEYAHGMTCEEMLRRAATLPPDAIILISPYFNDASGATFVPSEIVGRVSRVASVPVFGTHRAFLGRGIVGGSLLTTEATGHEAGKVALDYLNGRLRLTTPVTTFHTATQMAFDWLEITRWKADPALLPTDSVVINRPLTLWGQYRVAVTTAAVVLLALTGLVVALLVLNRRLRRMTIAAHESEARFRVMVERAPEAILVYDPGLGRTVDANARAERLFGCGREELLRGGPERFYPPCPPRGEGAGKSIHDHEARALAGEEVVFECEVRGDEGKAVPCEVRLVLLPFHGQRLVRASFIDVTDRRKAEEERRHLEAQLLQVQRMESLGCLAGGVAHDMNNVLGTILGMASVHVDAQPPGSRIRAALETIIKAAERGARMVQGLLSFARRSAAEERDLEVNTLLREQVQLLEHTTLAGVRLEMDLAADLPLVRGDASALSRAFTNLCVNAVDAMPDHGVLTLRTRNADPGWIEIQVEDTGCGMPAEILARAMDPFFTTKDVGQGTGLGLSVVYSAVKAHHGQLDVRSAPGQGTCVTMRFPACVAVPRISAPRAAEPASAASRETLSVLVVDDDDLVRGSVQAMLEVLGHASTPACSGEEALATLEGGFQPGVVIMDLNMPGLGGAGTLPRLRALHPSLAVLLVTGRADDTAVALAEAHPRVTLLAKPFTVALLREGLEKAVRGPREGDE